MQIMSVSVVGMLGQLNKFISDLRKQPQKLGFTLISAKWKPWSCLALKLIQIMMSNFRHVLNVVCFLLG